jgi:hypothetical protein
LRGAKDILEDQRLRAGGMEEGTLKKSAFRFIRVDVEVEISIQTLTAIVKVEDIPFSDSSSEEWCFINILSKILNIGCCIGSHLGWTTIKVGT